MQRLKFFKTRPMPPLGAILLVLLLLLALGEFYGGVTMILDPTGDLLQMQDGIIEQIGFIDGFLLTGILMTCLWGFYRLERRWR